MQDVGHAMVLRFPSLYSETMNYTRKDFLVSQLQWLGLVGDGLWIDDPPDPVLVAQLSTRPRLTAFC
jgi:hypothetical protein